MKDIDQTVAFVDLETTGIDPLNDHILEVAIIRVTPDETDSRCWAIYDHRPVPPGAIAVNGLTEEYLEAHGRPRSIVFKEVQKVLNCCDLFVAHNARFDMDFLRAAGITLPPQTLCTLRLARHLCPGLDSFALGALYAPLAKKAERLVVHQALPDAQMLRTVFEHFIDLVKKQSLDAPLEALLDLQSRVPIDYKMPTGKHRGTPIRDLPLGYIEWAVKASAFDGDLNEALAAVLVTRRGG